MSFESLINSGEYFSAHYLAEVLPKDLKGKGGLIEQWSRLEKEKSPRGRLRGLRQDFLAARVELASNAETNNTDLRDPVWQRALEKLHDDVLTALGFKPVRAEIVVELSGAEHSVPVVFADTHVIAIECGWAADVDAALDGEAAGRLMAPVQRGGSKQLVTGAELVSFLFAAPDPVRYVLILVGGVVVLADRFAWGEGRFLAVRLGAAFERNDTSSAGELDTIAALFASESLHPPAEGGENPLSTLVDASNKHAVGVSGELREGLRRSVELIANEVLNRIRQAGVALDELAEPRELADRLRKESLRYLYRILFLLYAEARPELGVLPSSYPEYAEGYGMARLGELVSHPLTSEEAGSSFHLYESLSLLFKLVNDGYHERAMGEVHSKTSEDEGIRFEKLNSDLFMPESITMIGELEHPGWDDGRTIDTRLRNTTLHQVLKLLMFKKGTKRERGGFISYAQLGINQLGAVYEGLMSYTGFIATEELYEVARKGDSSGGTWTVPASKATGFDDSFVYREDEDTRQKVPVRHHAGSFVYRLAGRDRQTSASYYTPESLAKVTVELALKQRIEENPTPVKAADLLTWKICEPALGSGAFLNEAINQVAAKYLRMRQDELGRDIPPENYDFELRKVKAYIALHNAYGVDLNETAVELAEVSIWLNVMHPGLAAPWFGLHLRRGNSLIGAGRRYYTAEQLSKGDWLRKKDPLPAIDCPLRDGPLPEGAVHQFLLPAIGWGSIVDEKEARELAPEDWKRLAAWRNGIRQRPKKGAQIKRLQGLARRAEYLWGLVVRRLEISEREISRQIDVWEAPELEHPSAPVQRQEVFDDLHRAGTPYWRLKVLMDTWCALWSWPVHQGGLLDGSDNLYPGSLRAAEQAEVIEQSSALPFAHQTALLPALQEPLFGEAIEVKAVSSAKVRGSKVRRRNVVPLKELNDWLDFAEGLLGAEDLQEGTLFTELNTLAELDELELTLPAQMGMDSQFDLAARFPWFSEIVRISLTQGFFHWELDFAHLFTVGGFDLQLGNPPWVRPEWDESVVLAEADPWFGTVDLKVVADSVKRSHKTLVLNEGCHSRYYLQEMATQAAISRFIGSPITYELLSGTQPDFYRGFMIRAWANIAPSGVAALLHPDTHFNGAKEGRLREAAYRRLRVHGDYMNAGNRFFAPPVGRKIHFGLHVYGPPKEVGFYHLSWLFSATVLTESLELHRQGVAGFDGELAVGVKFDGTWDARPDASRVIYVDRGVLEEWAKLEGNAEPEASTAKLLSPVSTAESEAILTLGGFSRRLGDLRPQISSGYHEKGAKDNGIIRWEVNRPSEWADVILQGPHFAIATPYSKEAPQMGNMDRAVDLSALPVEAVPAANYVRATNTLQYVKAQDRWIDYHRVAEIKESCELVDAIKSRLSVAKGCLVEELSESEIQLAIEAEAKRPYTEFFRVAWREMVPPNNERSLFASIIPPGPAHVHAVRSMTLPSRKQNCLLAGFWAALPMDYISRISGGGHLDSANARAMPAPDVNHPLAGSLLLRSLRLNCLTKFYGELWNENFSDRWSEDGWAVNWPSVSPLGAVSATWTFGTPLRTELERRAALVEIDALVAVWLGLSADHLATIYGSRYSVLSDYEDVTWFDGRGRKISGNRNSFGHGQTKAHFDQLMRYIDGEGAPPEGYEAPFYKVNRVREMRQAHEVFSKRLEEAQ